MGIRPFHPRADSHIFQIWLIIATAPVHCEELVEGLMPINNDNDNNNNYKSEL